LRLAAQEKGRGKRVEVKTAIVWPSSVFSLPFLIFPLFVGFFQIPNPDSAFPIAHFITASPSHCGIQKRTLWLWKSPVESARRGPGLDGGVFQVNL
jgi:hypothetical protein